MKPRLTLYPLGNADSCLIELTDGRLLLMDSPQREETTQRTSVLTFQMPFGRDLGTRRDVDVLAISHLDEDHYGGVSDLFYLDHAVKYQSADRIRIRELWVPAAVIVEEGLDATEAKVIRAEARHRLKEGKGIRVYSRPEALEDWLNQQGLNLTDRAHLITDAGCVVPGYSYASGGVEMFVHSPFAEAASDGRAIVRNSSSLALQATFKVGDRFTRVLFAADLHHEDLVGIVRVTKAHANRRASPIRCGQAASSL